jgi:hypothetical protein
MGGGGAGSILSEGKLRACLCTVQIQKKTEPSTEEIIKLRIDYKDSYEIWWGGGWGESVTTSTKHYKIMRD